MSLLKHKGLSGAAIEVVNGRVRKWTRGSVAAPELRNAATRQANADFYLLPILAAPILSIEEKEDYFAFEMDIYPETAFTSFSDKIEKNIGLSLGARLLGNYRNFIWDPLLPVSGFKDSQLKKDFQREWPQAVHFPYGYAHGDFGFANMMVEDDQIYMIDFTTPLIQSPLVDIATMEMSLFADAATKKHADFVAKIRDKYSDWKHQIDLIRKVKVLSYNKPDECRDIFYGFFK